MTSWSLLTIIVARELEELASFILFDHGTTGVVTLEESASVVKLGAYFDEQTDAEEVARSVEAALARAGQFLRSVSVSAIPDQDWMQKWKEGFEPIEIGERLVVAPSWKLPSGSAGRAVIRIDPGMAFGTGTHETTRLCLDAIERYWRGGSLLDAGTGTGILAIAAAMLVPGSTVTAIDIDPLAVDVARENIEINGVAGSIKVLEGQPAQFAGSGFDMVVANLTAEVIISLISDLAACVRPFGLLIFSGILTTLRDDVERAAEAAGLKIIEWRDAGEWSGLVAREGSA